MSEQGTFTREDTRAVKGAAIMLMLVHHLFSFPKRMPGGIAAISGPFAGLMTGSGDPWFVTFGLSCRVCVGLFVMLSGYGMYAQYEAGRLRLGRKIWNLYISYWEMLIVMLPISFLFFRTPAAYELADRRLIGKYASVNPKDLILTILGVSTAYNREWWCFIGFVICFVIGAAYLRLTRRVRLIWIDIILCVALNYLINHLLPALGGGILQQTIVGSLWWKYYYNLLAPFLAGILCAKYSLFDACLRMASRLAAIVRGMIGIGIVIASFALRLHTGGWLDYIIAPALAMGIALIAHAWGGFGRVLGFLGRYSAYMWLTHSFYCYYWPPFALLVYASGNALADLGILTALALGTSIGITYLWKQITRLARSIRSKA